MPSPFQSSTKRIQAAACISWVALVGGGQLHLMGKTFKGMVLDFHTDHSGKIGGILRRLLTDSAKSRSIFCFLPSVTS